MKISVQIHLQTFGVDETLLSKGNESYCHVVAVDSRASQGSNAFLHIPKTAGSAISTAIGTAQLNDGVARPEIFGHEVSLMDLSGHNVVFCVRDPVERVISGFYSRRRMGRPRNDVRHTKEEAKTFRRWTHFEDLARDVLRGEQRAIRAWASIKHLRPLSTWLVSVNALASANIAYVADVRTLGDEWPRVREVLGLSESAALPSSPIDAHRAPTPAPEISPEVRRDLAAMLWHDYVLVEECHAIRRRRRWAG